MFLMLHLICLITLDPWVLRTCCCVEPHWKTLNTYMVINNNTSYLELGLNVLMSVMLRSITITWYSAYVILCEGQENERGELLIESFCHSVPTVIIWVTEACEIRKKFLIARARDECQIIHVRILRAGQALKMFNFVTAEPLWHNGTVR